MRVIPALDLRAGHVVRLRQGDFDQETVFSDDPVGLAAAWVEAGAKRLHVVDLDAARGSGHNRTQIAAMVTRLGVEVQVAGGVRDAQAVAGWLQAGASAVVMGTAALVDWDLVSSLCRLHPGRILAALDVKAGRPALRGWLESIDSPLEAVLEAWNGAPLEGVIVTSVDRDGTLDGPDLEVLARARSVCRHPITYSGGISSIAHLEGLAAAGADGVILGRSLLEGRITLAEAVRGAW